MLNQYVSRLYQGKPLTKTVPFNVIIADAKAHILWKPDNAYFEVLRMYIRSTVGGIDLNIVDTDAANVFGFVVPDTLFYTPVDFAPAAYRAINFASNSMAIVDPLATGAQFKGFIEGWEVTREGSYR